MEWAFLLLLLICPLMMLFMHRGHNHGNHDHDDKDNVNDYKVKQLEGKVELLKAQNETLQRKLENFPEDVSQR